MTTTETHCRDTRIEELGRPRREAARAIRLASASASDALLKVAAAKCSENLSHPSCIDALRALEEAVRRSEASTTALRALWNELSGCSPGCDCSR